MSRKSPKNRGSGSKRKRAAGVRTAASETDLLFARMVRDVGRELAAAGPLDAELCVSELVGSWWGQAMVDADPEVVLGEALVEYAARRGSPAALAVLRGMAELGTPAQRQRATQAAEALAARGVPDPPWASRLGDCVPTGAWAYGDVYGDQTSVLVAFERGGDPHGIAVLVDHTLGGIAKDAFAVADPADALDDLRVATEEPVTWLRTLPLAEASAILDAALASTERATAPPVIEGFREVRALVVARLRALPAPPRPPAAVPPVDETERARIVAEFADSTARPSTLTAAEAAACIRLIVDYGCDHDGGAPMRVSPAKADVFLLSWLPEQLAPDDPRWAAMSEVYPAWVRWAGERSRLPEPALAELYAVVAEIVEVFADDDLDDDLDDDDGPPEVLLEAVLDGLLDETTTPEALQDAVLRRMFAMPLTDALIGGREYSELNPTDPDERRLLIIGEHPEYQAMLDDPTFDVTEDGVSPRAHIATHEMIAEQLWNGEPEQLWPAAQRLLAGGADRHEVLHALGHAALGRLHTALTTRHPFDAEGYAADLDALGAPRPRRTRRRRRAGAQDRLFDGPQFDEPLLDGPGVDEPEGKVVPLGVGPVGAPAAYRIKVALRHTKPPVWRRLVVPAAITLADLHEVLQVAMGWTDSHLHQFSDARRVFGPPDPDAGPDQLDEARFALRDLLRRPGDRVRYEYDFGDGWEHDIVLEEATPGSGAVTCLAGRRACPPEDCGGPWGYAELCAAVTDRAHPRHDELREWAGDYFAPAEFDRDEVNRMLAAIDGR